MLPFVIGILLIPLFLGGGLLIVGLLNATGGMGTMNTAEERRAVIFEIYRYSICYVMVMVFALMAFQLLGAVMTDMSNVGALASAGTGVLLSGILFLVHWKMKSPAAAASDTGKASNHP